jgi:hypothetical protein
MANLSGSVQPPTGVLTILGVVFAVVGHKPKMGRAHLVYLDSHVELRRNAPTNLLDPNVPFPAAP